VKYILNVTTKCPNYHEEDKEFEYKRIAVTDTGTQKLSQHFREAFEFIELARKVDSCVLIHCMAALQEHPKPHPWYKGHLLHQQSCRH
jgi:hypothetical protein